MNYYLKPTQVDPLSILRIRQLWQETVAGGMDVHELPCFGGMLVEPFVSSLAQQLKTCLDQVRTSAMG